MGDIRSVKQHICLIIFEGLSDAPVTSTIRAIEKYAWAFLQHKTKITIISVDSVGCPNSTCMDSCNDNVTIVMQLEETIGVFSGTVRLPPRLHLLVVEDELTIFLHGQRHPLYSRNSFGPKCWPDSMLYLAKPGLVSRLIITNSDSGIIDKCKEAMENRFASSWLVINLIWQVGSMNAQEG